MDNPTYDVAIIGLGPVGCAAAVFLAELGLRVVAIERDVEVYKLPRAVNLDGEIVRAFQGIGRGEELDALLQTVRPGDRAGFANSARQWMFGQDVADFGVNGWQGMNMFDQPEVEGYLRDLVVGHTNVDAKIGFEATGFVQDEQGVELTISALPSDDLVQAQPTQVKANYLVACDGASSPVRKALQIEWHDLGYDHEWLVVDVTVFDGHTLNNDTVQVCSPDRICTYVCTKDPYRRWEFKLLPGETREEMLDPERIMSLLDDWTPRETYEIRRAAVYQFHAATAASWRQKRVFIAGDAAHQTPPFLGQGMNTGMRDVINLAWKMELIAKGVCSAEGVDVLLNSYEKERTAHATDMVEWAVSIGMLMEHLARVEGAQRDGLPPPETPPALQSSGYGQGREAPPIRDGLVVLQQVSDKGSTGYLFSQPIVTSGQGESFKLDGLLGRGFALVHNVDLALNDASQQIVEVLGIKTIDIRGLQEEKGHIDNLFKDSGCALVRPDRIVYGHTTKNLNENDLLAQLAAQLCL